MRVMPRDCKICLFFILCALPRPIRGQTTQATSQQVTCQTSVDPLPKGQAKTYFCCKNVDWSSSWCKQADCFGPGCSISNQSSCPSLDSCLCKGRFSYRSKSSCSVLSSCSDAQAAFLEAEKQVLAITGYKSSDLEGCNDAIINVICAYFFPRCVHDLYEFLQICYRTCQNMYSKCSKPNGCQEGSNVTLLDKFGNPVLDSRGQVVQAACQNGTYPMQNYSVAISATRRAMYLESMLQRIVRGPSRRLQGFVDGRYFEFEPGQIKLSDFTKVGSRCDTCLTEAEVLAGYTCDPKAAASTFAYQSWDCAYNTRYKRGDCTSSSNSLSTIKFLVYCLPLILLGYNLRSWFVG
mmetsp:Transcript_22120/g.72841  ORF Transcript_22120/g.72841 Transcript_22120/m.72841 type:complete len:350 (-) Transcript_22120:1160-2209(-)